MKTYKSQLKVMGALVVLLLSSCYPNSDQYVSDYDSVFTLYAESGVDYGSYQTFFLVDTVYTIDKNGYLVPAEGANDLLILNKLSANMQAAGYTRVPNAVGADLVMLARTTKTTTVTIDYWYPWGGWGGWYYPYYPVSSVSSYTSGSLLVDLLDPNKVDPGTDQIGGIWTAYCSGLLSGSSSSITERVRASVDQAFKQSPYLRAN